MVLPLLLPLVPAPVSSTVDEGVLPLLAVPGVHGDRAAAALLVDAVARRTGIRLAEAGTGIALRIDPAVAAPEGYLLTVADHVEITGADATGLFYGIQTLLQLLRQDENGAWEWQRARIADAPRFGYRGVMLDVARHFFTVDEVKTVIDRCAALKFNHLHLHLSDDQGWRIHIDSWPLLSERSSTASATGDGSGSHDEGAGARGSGGGCYSKDDYREIVAHATSRHVTIVPEIDMPGHTHAIGVAYPELAEDPVMNENLLDAAQRLGHALPEAGVVYTGWGVGHSSLRIRDERTYDFIRDVLTELAEMTPGPYLHIGGDESLGTSPENFTCFIARATRIVTDLGKTPIAWHEAGAAEVAPGTIGQYWGLLEPSPEHAAHATRFVDRGGRIILSPSDAAYLDMKPAPNFPLGLAWAGIVDVHRAYGWEPDAVLDVPADAVAGIEAPLWTETVTSLADAEQLMYPRIAALAELAWSAPATSDSESGDSGSFGERLGRMAPLWRADGIRFHAPTEIVWSER
jgi:hexosaminidase